MTIKNKKGDGDMLHHVAGSVFEWRHGREGEMGQVPTSARRTPFYAGCNGTRTDGVKPGTQVQELNSEGEMDKDK